MTDEEKQTTGVRTVDALSEDEFQLLVAKMFRDMKVLRGCGNSVMSLVMGVTRAVVRLAYDTKVVVVREEGK